MEIAFLEDRREIPPSGLFREAAHEFTYREDNARTESFGLTQSPHEYAAEEGTDGGSDVPVR